MKKYEQCATRFEHRWEYPPTREYVDQYVRMALDTGCESVWHSAVTNSGVPLFPSKIYPNSHPEADLEIFHYMINRFHEIGRPVISWYGLQGSDAVAKAHPEWRAQFYKPEQMNMSCFELPHGTQNSSPENHGTLCFNSPYAELLPKFAAEIVRDVRFDGIFFDSSSMSSHITYPAYVPACQCGFCQEKFQADTGEKLPSFLDTADPVVRRWIAWRYDIVMGVWRSVVQAVYEVNPNATIVFNNYRRRSHAVLGWNVGIPLRKSPMNAVLGTELDSFPHQADLQIKINKAYGFAKGEETWWPMVDAIPTFNPDQDPAVMIQAAVGAMSAGGAMSCGIAMEPENVIHLMKPLQDVAGPMMQYVDGDDIDHIAILVSQHRMDYHGKIMDAWDEVHGAAEWCRQTQQPYRVIFDDYLNTGDLLLSDHGTISPRYAAILAPNAACISSQAAAALTEYVAAGGLLIGTCDIGVKDETGRLYDRPILDDLFGIASRTEGRGLPTLELSEELQRLCSGRLRLNTHHVSLLGGHVLPAPDAQAEVVAMVSDQVKDTWDADGYEGEAKAVRVPGMLRNRHGKGIALYIGAEFFRSFLRAPSQNGRKLLHALIQSERPAPVLVDAHPCVTVNVRRQGGQLLILLHNVPGTSHRYPVPSHRNYLYGAGDIQPVHDIQVRIDAAKLGFTSASRLQAASGITGKLYQMNGETIVVDRLEVHEVLVLTEQ